MLLQGSPQWNGENVILRPLTLDDVSKAYVDWLNDANVNQFLECRFTYHSLDSTREFVQNCLTNPATLILAIRCLSLANRHVGNVKIGPIDRNHHTAEIGILIGDRNARGKGVGTEVIKMVKVIARNELSLRRITAGCYKSNVASCKAFVKAGFTIEGERPNHFLLDGLPESLLLMGCSLD
jgi:ribosomal-protein-alanine N-acetyltransferase